MERKMLMARTALLLSILLFFTSLAGGGLAPSTAKAAAASAELLIIDNGEPGYAENPAWSASSIKGYNGTSTRVTGGVGNTASWTPNSGVLEGRYKVSIYKVKRPTASDDPNVRIDIVHGGVTDTKQLDFTQGVSEWVELGTYAFAGSGSELVRMTKTSAIPGTFVHADAVKFERAADSSDASLRGLSIDGGGSLSPVFSPTVTAYTYTAAPETSSITVTATVYDPQSSLKINGVQAASGVPSPALSLAPGDTVISITVTAGDGTTVRDYTITVTRPFAADPSLSSLSLQAGTLSPAFRPDMTDYSAEVDLQTSAIKVNAAPLDTDAVVRVNGEVVAGGHDSPAIPLVVGMNEITVEVTARDGMTTRTYHLHITRKNVNTIIIDYADGGYVETGSWTTSNTVKGYNLTSTRYTATAGATITWKPNITAGEAAVSFYKVNWPSSADSRVMLEIVHDGLTETRYVDLTPAGEGWVDLGTYAFAGTGNEYVRLTRITSSPTTIYTRADAVKFEGTVERKPDPLGPIRSRELPNLHYTEKGSIQNAGYKVTFYEAAWDGGSTIVRDISRRVNGVWSAVYAENERLEEQWVLLNGSAGDRANYYDTMPYDWLTFDGFELQDDKTVILTDSSRPDRYDFQVTWSLAAERPILSYAFTPRTDGNYVIGYQSFTTERRADVTEVLSGARNRAKMTGTVESTGLWELTAPMSLVEKPDASGSPFTYGLFIPAKQLPLQFEPTGTANNQRLGMSLINNEGDVQPILYAPQYGTYSAMTAGSTYRFDIGLYAEPGKTIYDAYSDILRSEYDYSAYRENVGSGSLNDAMYNMIELLKIEPQGDDSVDYVPSQSGWWNRAKGFVDIENQDAIRTAASSVLLGAYYLTGDDQLYETRALPMLEHGVSRNERGWSPKGAPVYGDPSLWKMAAVPFDVSTISSFYDMTRGQNAGLHALGLEEYRFRNPDQFVRGPVIQPLMTYRMTGDSRYLQEATAAADAYIASDIDTPSTAIPDRNSFFYSYGKLWVEILELYEETKDPKYLAAAHKEAKRYASIFVARPVPGGRITIPQPSPFRYDLAFRWSPESMYPYTRTRLPEDEPGASMQVDSWVVSPTGMTFEAGNTSAAYRMNAQEAPFMLRLASYTGDELLRDIAHNAVIGRYTNYPGYYYRGFIQSQQEPDFPLLGPIAGTSLYYHHAPAQLGQTMDYLVTEQMAKSNGSIAFPSVFETDFLWFKYHVYGSKPGTFYGNSDVWLWMPKGIISTDNKQLNWMTGESGNRFYIGLSNESHQAQQATIDLNEQLIGFDPSLTYPVTIIRDNGQPESAVMTGGQLQTSVSAQGLTAIIIDGMNIDVPLHRLPEQQDTSDKSYFFDTYSPIDAVKGMLLLKPDGTSYNAYIQAKTTKSATLHYSLNGGASFTALPDTIYPMEWSIPVGDPSQPFTYYVESEGKQTQKRTLYFPNHVATPPAQPAPEAERPEIVVDNMDAETEGSWARATAANGYYYSNYVTAKTTSGEPTSRIRFKPDLPETGLYEVYYKLPAGRSEWASDAALTVHYDGGEHTYTVNEKNANGEWQLFGTHRFAAGVSGDVELTNRAVSGASIAADAVMWVPESYTPTWESVTLTADTSVLMRTQTAQLRVSGVWDTGVPADLTDATIVYSVDRPDLVSVNEAGQVTLLGLDDSTEKITITASVTIGSETKSSLPLELQIRKLSVVVDSTDPVHYTETGTWKQSGLAGYNPNVRSRYTEMQGATATWQPMLPASKFNVSFYNIVRSPGADPSVQIEIKHAAGTEVRMLNASVGASGWVELGTYDFTGDGTEYVRMTRLTATSNPPAFEVYTRADAVKFDEVEDAEIAVTGLQVSPAAVLMNPHLAKELQLTAQVLPADATDSSVRWSTNDPTVAAVEPNGTVIPVEDGSVTITAVTTDGGFRASSEVTVDGKPPVIRLATSDRFLQSEGWTGEVIVEDSGSGIARTEYQIDGRLVEQPAIAPFSAQAGTHKLTITAEDKAGNVATSLYQIEVTVSREDLQALLRHGFEAGAITNEGVYRSLTAKLMPGANGWKALENEVKAQKGQHIQDDFAAIVLGDIAYLQDLE
ncbi:cadherin-like beta sandwich domain-containing protein [Bacillus sp. 3255]|uniref:golvesin C-terminal-like domain-containing protein n=1 Tax=Bacillus sp. 3255 TaxID=2817904 RepID=UPI00285D80CE|nr:cadherin-like beta sandwich domain-containing protein [Bacillus sp. 3255]MDR6878821.1 hypothetical protein [Bacillus sp. 3255]